MKKDIQASAGPLQTASSLKGGAEAAIHAMKEVFDNNDAEAIILVDAKNAFNALNRMVALHNIQILCPPFAKILINTYVVPSRLFISGGEEILSAEGTTQGDILAMSFYSLATTPLQNRLRRISVRQVWLADDATGGGNLSELKEWWDTIIEDGSKIGYYVNESKSFLILKNPEKLNEAKVLFGNTTIKKRDILVRPWVMTLFDQNTQIRK